MSARHFLFVLILSLGGFILLQRCTVRNNRSSMTQDGIRATTLTSIDFTVVEDTLWTALFRRDSGWFGGDGIFSIPLKSKSIDKGSDSVLFLFSDSVFGFVMDDSLHPGWRMTHNSVAYLDGNNPIPDKINFYSDSDDAGRPETIFIPRTSLAQEQDYYWLGDGFVNHAMDDNIYFLAYRMRNVNNDSWGFRQVGSTLIVLPSGDVPPFKEQKQLEIPFGGNGIDRDDISLGAGILDNTDASVAPYPDGYIYIYGVRGKNKELVVSRVLPEKIEDFDSWKFYDGTAWKTGQEHAATLTEFVSNELSVTPLDDGRYVLLFQAGGMSDEIGMRLSETPYGPFGPMIHVWKCRESDHKNYYTYNAKAHPALSDNGELVVSYNVNAAHFLDAIAQDPHLYRPRFIRIKFK